MLAVARPLLQARQVLVEAVQPEVEEKGQVQDYLCLHQKGVVLESQLTGGDVDDSSDIPFIPL